MFDLYERTTLECSKLITQRYSTSFSLGIRVLHRRFHMPIYAIYGFVRYADEIVDTFHEYNKAELLNRFRADTYRAIEEKISLNPVLHAFQWVVNQYQIEHSLIDAFLHSMEMDLSLTHCDPESYTTYIYGSAEVVGLMCLRVFCEGDCKLYEQLREPARRLGAAFQKINFLRDLRSDYIDRQRTYFPNVDFNQFTEAEKKQIEAEIAEDFRAGYAGICRLPAGARLGVYLAYVYYSKLFEKIRRLPAHTIMHRRVRIPNTQKLLLLLHTYTTERVLRPFRSNSYLPRIVQ